MIFETSFLCLECGKPYTSDNDNVDNMYSFVKTTNNVWCNVCSVKYMQENLCTWSGNEIIDNFTKEKQIVPRIFLNRYLIISLKI